MTFGVISFLISQGRCGVANDGRFVGVKLLDRPRHETVHFHVSGTVQIRATRDDNGKLERSVERLRDEVGRRFRDFVRIRSFEMMCMLNIWQVIVIAVCLVGRGNDYSLYMRVALARLQHIPCSLNIDLKSVQGVVYRLIDDRLRGKMEHDIDIVPAKELIQEREIADVATRNNDVFLHAFALEQSAFILFVYQNDGFGSAFDEFGNNVTT